MFQEFKKFIMRGNVLDLAIGVIIGAAFGKIVTSMVNDIMMPVVGLFVGKVDFSNLFIPLNGQHYETLADAKRAAAPTVNYGVFANAVIEFLIIAFVIFIVVKQVNRLFKPAPVPVTSKTCPECCTSIPLGARRCPACTSALAADASA